MGLKEMGQDGGEKLAQFLEVEGPFGLVSGDPWGNIIYGVLFNFFEKKINLLIKVNNKIDRNP